MRSIPRDGVASAILLPLRLPDKPHSTIVIRGACARVAVHLLWAPRAAALTPGQTPFDRSLG